MVAWLAPTYVAGPVGLYLARGISWLLPMTPFFGLVSPPLPLLLLFLFSWVPPVFSLFFRLPAVFCATLYSGLFLLFAFAVPSFSSCILFTMLFVDSSSKNYVLRTETDFVVLCFCVFFLCVFPV